ncbi:MAG: DUF86 domain-containing protein [Gammaproteobacteria bacterium]|nr:DUF86 domain-containing protein [Gammaproteobacteria bacterium]NIR85033.1 DUF86 domain-containing protein [Gammaproteobacteria bacterium]NIR88300.1 DUF86 domain-containing protein [Gammaproteobacteria bacterium]NIU06080.1 DUF86 domain-containing protein [Gammaproteobacteria bacterium]NIV73499.1 DUF86 domain-containing protein [Gammaproteobacteria bacterium]
MTSQELAADEDRLNVVLMDLQQAIQGCIDLAVHACADEALGAPAGPGDAFALLARAGRIDAGLAERLTGAAGLRNLIVHRYASVETDKVLAVIRDDLGDLEAFVAALRG